MRRFAAFAAAAFGLALPSVAKATTYYVSPSGADAAVGTSPASPWRTIAKVNATGLAPGDRVLFRSRSVFDGVLMPSSSGSPRAPIVFGTYGAGRANLRGGITLVSKSWITLENLTVDTGDWRSAGKTRGVFAHDNGTGSKNIVVQSCRLRNVSIGILLANQGDVHWVVRNSLIQDTRDSGIIIFSPTTPNGIGGDDLLFEGNTIVDTGRDASMTYPKHGVYSKGTNVTFRNNVLRNWSADRDEPDAALSVRAHNTRVEGNVISGGSFGINWSGYDTFAGTSRFAYNRISNVATGIDITERTGPAPTVENFVIANNTIVTNTAAGIGRGIRTQSTAGFIKLANNVVTGAHYYDVWLDGLPRGGFVDEHNIWHAVGGADRWRVDGTEYTTLAGYRTATRQGAGDRAANPRVDANLVPAATSPVIDAGSKSFDAATRYFSDCTGAPFHFCGWAPDAGAVETPSIVATPPRPGTLGRQAGRPNVPRRFVVVARARVPFRVWKVVSRIGGRRVCVDRRAPFTCRIRARPGLHRISVRLRSYAGRTRVLVLRVHVTRSSRAFRRGR